MNYNEFRELIGNVALWISGGEVLSDSDDADTDEYFRNLEERIDDEVSEIEDAIDLELFGTKDLLINDGQ